MLLGVGYIIGPRIASVMVAGGLTTALLIVPMIAYFGNGLPAPLAPVQQQRIAEMEPGRDRLDVRPLHRRRRGGDRRHLEHAQRPAADHQLHHRQPARPGLRQAMSSPAAFRAPSETCRCPSFSSARSPSSLVIATSYLDTDRLLRPAGRRGHGRAIRVSVRHRQLANHGRDRLVVESDLGYDHRHAAPGLLDLRRSGLGRAGIPIDGALDRRRGLHRLIQRRDDVARSEDRLPGRCNALEAAGRHSGRCA